MKIEYEPWNPKPAAQIVVAQANEIIAEWEADGYTLTLRQLYYQFVGKGWMENTFRNYKNFGNTMTKARMAGMVSWTAIEDRTRTCHSYYFEEDPLEPIESLPAMISFDQWKRQDYYVECWVEKEALGNVIERACSPFLVPHLACKGYLSASEAWRGGRRFRRAKQDGKKCVVLHLGDHDPSGMHMTEDNQNRLDTFAGYHDVEVRRIALNIDQVEQYDPPPNYAKETDSRHDWYVETFNTRDSWELDALDPNVINELITKEIKEFIDDRIWEETRNEERAVQRDLELVHDNWDAIKEFMDTQL